MTQQSYHFKIILGCFVLFFIFSCSTVKKVPEGEKLLSANVYQIEGKNYLESSLNDYAVQKPNKKIFFIVPLKLWSYNSPPTKYDSVFAVYNSLRLDGFDRTKMDSLYRRYGIEEDVGRSRWWKRFRFNNGEPPVLYDPLNSEKTAAELEKFYKKKGFWNATVSFDTLPSNALFNKDKKIKVVYKINPGQPSKIDEFSYLIEDKNIQEIYESKFSQTLIKTGEWMDQTVLEKEVERINRMMKNNGYYNFNRYNNDIVFYTDSIDGTQKVPLEMEIVKTKISDSTSDFKKFYYDEITVEIANREQRSQSIHSTENLTTEGEYLIYNPNKKYKDNVVTNALVMSKGSAYSADDEVQSYRNLNSLDNFNIREFKIEPSGNNDSLLRMKVSLEHKIKNDIEFSFNTQYSNFLNIGFSPSISWKTRNVFNGAENFDITLTGVFGTVEDESGKSSFLNANEFSLQSTLHFPRLLLPNSWNTFSKKYTKTTDLIIGGSSQNNTGLGRINLNFNLNYSLSPNKIISHKLGAFNSQFSLFQDPNSYYFIRSSSDQVDLLLFFTLFDIDYPDVLSDYNINNGDDIDDALRLIFSDYNDTFVNDLFLSDPQLAQNTSNIYYSKLRTTQDFLINSISYAFNYNEFEDPIQYNPIKLSVRIESAGTLIALVDNWVGLPKSKTFINDEVGSLFGVPYSQFFKIDVDFVKQFRLTDKSRLLFHTFFGLGYPYGNVNYIPYIRNYFAGGSNDVRGWQPLELTSNPENTGFNNVNNLKITTNLEWRFPLNQDIEGAVFVDAGNIWATDELTGNKFEWDRFYKEFGIGSGFGLRYNIQYFIIRLDLGFKLYNPELPEGNRWLLRDFTLSTLPQLHFAIDYPF